MGPRKPRATILIADTAEAIGALKATLAGDDVKFVTATTLAEALAHLKRRLKLILCGIHFDRGKMFEFLQIAKKHPRTANVPFVCVRASGIFAKPLMPRGIEMAARELGAAAYVDHVHAENMVGAAKAGKALRKALITACRPGTAASLAATAEGRRKD